MTNNNVTLGIEAWLPILCVWCNILCNQLKKKSLDIHLNPDPINPDIDPHVCSPGSTISGTVLLKVYREFNAQSIKIGFIGTESINFLLLGWNGDNDNGRIFTTRSPVWTAPSTDDSLNSRPNLEAGEMMFPFAFEMPMVNYPPLAELQRITSAMTIVASLERHGGGVIYSLPCVLNFQPIIETPINVGCPRIESKDVGKGDTLNISIDQLFYNINESPVLSAKVWMDSCSYYKPAENTAPEVRVYLNRCLTVSNGRKESKEYTAIWEVTSLLAPKSPSEGRRDSATGPLELDVSIPISPMTIPSVTYSKRCSIHYELCVSIRDTSFFSFGKKEVFSVGLFFGTLSCGTRSPADLLAFTDEVVTPDNPVTKPRRVERRPLSIPPPAYDDISPPVYTEEVLSAPG
ncbi:hypothetical protein CLU79DRAFT_883744 [Phycomyces nitens]|nr:hypothetical protein CLU79DRAFT_883744 [Phycomyces nitens]